MNPKATAMDKFDQPDVKHAMGVLATKSLGGPVPYRDVNDAIKVLHKQGLIPRTNMSADEAFNEAYSNKSRD